MQKLKKYCVIACTVFSVFTSSLIVTKAAGTQATLHTLYKTNTLGNAYEYVVISVEFADYTSGTIVIEVGNLSFYDYMVFGARLSNIYSSGNTRRLTLQVDDCKQVCIYCLPHSGSMVSISPSIYSNNTAYVEHVNQSFIEEQFTTTNGYIDDLESTCNSIYTDVHNIYLELVNQSLDLDNIQTQLTNIGNYLNTNNASLTTLINLMTVNNQALLNIANGITDLIGQAKYDISQESLPAYLYMSSLSSSGLCYEDGDIAPWYILDGGNPTSYNAPGRFMVPANTSVYLSYYSQMYTSPDAIYTSDGSSGMTYELLYSEAGYYWKQFTYKITNSSTSAKLCSLHWTYTTGKVIPIYFGRDRNMTLTMSRITHIPSSDIYTDRQDDIITKIQTIINWLNTYQQNDYSEVLNEINEKLDGIEGTQTSNNNVIDFDMNMDIINDIESDISVDFGTYDNTFQNTESNKWQFDSQLQSPVNALQGVFTSVIGFVPVAGTWLSVLLLCAVIIALLG